MLAVLSPILPRVGAVVALPLGVKDGGDMLQKPLHGSDQRCRVESRFGPRFITQVSKQGARQLKCELVE